jgi:hypothetical protein
MEKFRFIFLLAVFNCTVTFSQETTVQKTDTTGLYRLSDVVISATRTFNSTTELANSISIIDSVEIANKQKYNLFDLLKSEYGFNTLQFGPLGGLGTISIRGSNAGHSLVLIDGVEMNLPSESSNLYDFANLPVESIKKIEILRGPQSTLYGSDALAGVVNIITKKDWENQTFCFQLKEAVSTASKDPPYSLVILKNSITLLLLAVPKHWDFLQQVKNTATPKKMVTKEITSFQDWVTILVKTQGLISMRDLQKQKLIWINSEVSLVMIQLINTI